jgi:hypothetical protein
VNVGCSVNDIQVFRNRVFIFENVYWVKSWQDREADREREKKSERLSIAGEVFGVTEK